MDETIITRIVNATFRQHVNDNVRKKTNKTHQGFLDLNIWRVRPVGTIVMVRSGNPKISDFSTRILIRCE